jgi:hypothetical protein
VKWPSSKVRQQKKDINPLQMVVGVVIISLIAVISWRYMYAAINEYVQVQSWVSHTAKMTELDINAKSASIVMKYRYGFEGKIYSGSRIDLDFVRGTDHQSILTEYSRLYEMSSSPIQIYIDPNNPSDSIMQRNFPSVSLVFIWFFVVPLFYFGIFLIKLGLGRFTINNDSKSVSQAIASIESSGFFLYPLIFRIFSFVAFVILLPAMVIFYLDRLETLNQVLVVSSTILFFPILGFYLYRYGMAKKRKFDEVGTSLLSLSPNPATNEGEIGGYIELFSAPQGDFKITLECSHHQSFGSGRDIRSEYTVRWRKSSQCWTRRFGSKRHHVSFVFSLPNNLPSSHEENKNKESIVWVLSCTGNVITHTTKNEQVFERSWEIPVIKGNKNSNFQAPTKRLKQS